METIQLNLRRNDDTTWADSTWHRFEGVPRGATFTARGPEKDSATERNRLGGCWHAPHEVVVLDGIALCNDSWF
jgi:hypothetical protein